MSLKCELRARGGTGSSGEFVKDSFDITVLGPTNLVQF